MTILEEAIHHNRDENSFTARLFERLVIRFEKDQNYFESFLNCICHAAINNEKIIKNNTLRPHNDLTMTYLDSMLFLENIDLFSYCINNQIKINVENIRIDKTEFDFVIVGENAVKQSVFIVFEVKCFSDLVNEEITRQNLLLQLYRKAGLYNQFYHFALVSHENIVNGSNIKKAFASVENFSIVTWEDLKEYVDYGRIKKEIEFSKLFKKISYSGERSIPRRLLAK